MNGKLQIMNESNTSGPGFSGQAWTQEAIVPVVDVDTLEHVVKRITMPDGDAYLNFGVSRTDPDTQRRSDMIFEIFNPNGELLVAVGVEGRLYMGKDYMADEAAKHFWTGIAAVLLESEAAYYESKAQPSSTLPPDEGEGPGPEVLAAVEEVRSGRAGFTVLKGYDPDADETENTEGF